MRLQARYSDKEYEIGLDEAGRGPLFGRVYAAAVILPNDFDCTKVKDSKKFTSERAIRKAEDYIKSCCQYSISWRDSKRIDEINILAATMECMHEAAKELLNQNKSNNILLLIDGNYFKPLVYVKDGKLCSTTYVLINKGDNSYASIAAASILAKCARDKYIYDICKLDPTLDLRYGLRLNKGYGSVVHIDGIKKYGICIHHRTSFSSCRISYR